MTRLEHGMHTATGQATRGCDGASRIAWRSLLATVGGAFGVVLLATPCFAQTVATAAAGTSVSGLPSVAVAGATEHNGNAIRPFRINVPEEALADLRRRVVATRWPERETVTDQSQGVQLAKIQPLIQYWGTDYDWRKAEAKLNALPQFVTTIDGVDIQFVHVKSRHPNAMPLIMTHGWPGSIFELLKVVGPLTDPTRYGGRPEDAFDLVMPTLPGYGFSGKPQGSPWGPDRMGRAWDALMQRLGYTRYVSQGGDWGAIGSREANRKPLTPQAELQWWYQFYFATERGRAGYEAYRSDFARLIWQIASPKWRFDDATFDRSAASFDNPDHVSIVIHNYRWRLGLAEASLPMTASRIGLQAVRRSACLPSPSKGMRTARRIPLRLPMLRSFPASTCTAT